MGFPSLSTIVQTGANALPIATFAIAARRQAELQAEETRKKDAVQTLMLKRQGEQDALSQALGRANISHLNAQTNAADDGQWGQAFNAEDETGPGMFQQHKRSGEVRRVTVGGAPHAATAPAPVSSAAPPMPGDSQDMMGEQEPGSPPQQGASPAPKPSTVRPYVKPAPNTPHNMDPLSKEGIAASAARAAAVAKAEAPFKKDPNAPPASSGRAVASIQKALATNQKQLSVIDDALRELDAYPDAVGLKRGIPFVADRVDQRVDPKGVAARAAIANIGSLQIHDRTGAAMTVHEEPRLRPFVPDVSDTPEAIRTKLKKLKESIGVETQALQGSGASHGGGRGSSPGPATSHHAPPTGEKPHVPTYEDWKKAQGIP